MRFALGADYFVMRDWAVSLEIASAPLLTLWPNDGFSMRSSVLVSILKRFATE
jgi:hypothetical protein